MCIRFWITLVPVLLVTPVSFGTTQKPVLNIKHWQTTNGAEVYYVNTPEIPMVQINVVFDAGSGRDENKAGLAQFTNAMLNQGAKGLTADQIAQQFDDVGAQFNSAVNRDMAVVSLQSLTESKYLLPAMKTFEQVLTTPIFPQDAFFRTKNQILSAIENQNQSPNIVAANVFYNTIYANQPYRFPVLGNQETINAITVNDLTHFYKKYYVAKNAIVTFVGAVDQQQAHALVEQIIQHLPSGQVAPPLSLTNAIATTDKEKKIKFPAEQTSIIMGQVGINYQSPDYFPLLVGNYVLGGSVFSSRLFSEVREKRGLAYSVGSTFKLLAANGPFVIALQTRNSEVKQSIQIVRDILNQFIQQGPTETELTRTKRQIINGFPLTLSGNDAISDYLIMIGFYHLPLNYLDTYQERINQVTAAQVKQSFQKLVKPDQMVTVMVGNGSSRSF